MTEASTSKNAHASHVWRSLLFVPANNEKLITKAHSRGADAIILDLEDSVAPDQKSSARGQIASAAKRLAENSVDVLVRVNAEMLSEDIQAAAIPEVKALVLPKVYSADCVTKASELIDQREQERGLVQGGISVLAQIEDVAALPNLDSIANSSNRLLGMSLGSEDFSASANMLPLPETLYAPNQQVVFACRRVGILPFGFPASIAQFSDIEALNDAVNNAVNMGFVGAFCIHPNQVKALNTALTPDDEAVEEARTLLSQFDKAQKEGVGVFAYNGKMIDLPVILRARELIARADAIALKPSQ